MGKSTMEDEHAIVPIGLIEQSILLIRGQKVILDSDLAQLYGVSTGRLNEQVKRNRERFPDDFMFQLDRDEVQSLGSHFAILKTSRTAGQKPSRRGKHTKFLPYAFTEHGAIMAASVLNSPQAVAVSVYVVRAFVKMREMVGNQRLLVRRLDQIERKVHKHDKQILAIIEAIRQLMEPPPEKKRKPIGFASEKDGNG